MKNSTRGFMLYDSVVAIFLLSVMGFGAFKVYLVGIDYMRGSSQKETAYRAMNNQWELLRSEPIDQLSNYHGAEFLSTHETEFLPDPESAIRIDESEGMYTVTLTVSWFSAQGRRTEEQLVGLRSF